MSKKSREAGSTPEQLLTAEQLQHPIFAQISDCIRGAIGQRFDLEAQLREIEAAERMEAAESIKKVGTVHWKQPKRLTPEEVLSAAERAKAKADKEARKPRYQDTPKGTKVPRVINEEEAPQTDVVATETTVTAAEETVGVAGPSPEAEVTFHATTSISEESRRLAAVMSRLCPDGTITSVVADGIGQPTFAGQLISDVVPRLNGSTRHHTRLAVRLIQELSGK